MCCASNVYGVHSYRGFDSLPSYKSEVYCCPAPLRSLFPCSWLILFGIHFERVPFLLKQAVQHNFSNHEFIYVTISARVFSIPAYFRNAVFICVCYLGYRVFRNIASNVAFFSLIFISVPYLDSGVF